MKLAIISIVIAAITAGLGIYGLQGWDGMTGERWFAVFGATFIFPYLATDSLILACIIHLAICAGVVWLIAKMYRKFQPQGGRGRVAHRERPQE